MELTNKKLNCIAWHKIGPQVKLNLYKSGTAEVKVQITLGRKMVGIGVIVIGDAEQCLRIALAFL